MLSFMTWLPILVSSGGEIRVLDVERNRWVSASAKLGSSSETVAQVPGGVHFFLKRIGSPSSRIATVHVRAGVPTVVYRAMPASTTQVFSVATELNAAVLTVGGKHSLAKWVRNRWELAQLPQGSWSQALLSGDAKHLALVSFRRLGVNSASARANFFNVSRGAPQFVASAELGEDGTISQTANKGWLAVKGGFTYHLGIQGRKVHWDKVGMGTPVMTPPDTTRHMALYGASGVVTVMRRAIPAPSDAVPLCYWGSGSVLFGREDGASWLNDKPVENSVTGYLGFARVK